MTVTQATGDPARGPAGGVPVLELERVSKVYPGQPPVRALDQVSLTVTDSRGMSSTNAAKVTITATKH